MTSLRSATLRRLLLPNEQLTSEADQVRVTTRLGGRGLLDDGTEFDCYTSDISASDISFVASIRPTVGRRVVVYLEVVGGLEGHVAQATPNGFRVTFEVTTHKREKLARQLAWLMNRDTLGVEDLRLNKRIVPRHLSYRLQVGDRAECAGIILDVSRTGAALRASVKPPIGARVIIGSTRAKAVRTFEDGFAISFARPIPVENFGSDLIL
ncbi:MAG: type pilus assembly PilZ [Hyphomicrobiales bacterium]|nr:type pilus assembly PilZ [Hyphomicrobiales bacterium]